MSHSDPIANAITIIRNGQQTRLAQVYCPSSAKVKGVLNVLQGEGYIKGFDEAEERPGVKKLTIDLRYHNGNPVIKEITRISKPGRRIYAQSGKLPRVYNGIGISILSTSKGVMADHQARAENIGGEILCSVF